MKMYSYVRTDSMIPSCLNLSIHWILRLVPSHYYLNYWYLLFRFYDVYTECNM